MRAPVKKTKSGEHPAVIGYRRKLESVTASSETQLAALDAALDRELERVRTPVPPPPDSDPDTDPQTPSALLRAAVEAR